MGKEKIHRTVQKGDIVKDIIKIRLHVGPEKEL